MRIESCAMAVILVCFGIHSIGQNVRMDSLTDTAFIQTEHLHKQKGYFNNTQLGMGFRLGMPVVSISTVNGYQFSRVFSLGLGVGYCHTYVPLWTVKNWFKTVAKSDTRVGIDEINVFIEPRIFAGNPKGSLFGFFMLDIGYSFFLSSYEQKLSSQDILEWRNAHSHPPIGTLVKTSYSGGILIAPGFGLKTFLTRNFSLNFSIQLYFSLYKRHETEDYVEGYSVGNQYLYPLLNLGIGL
jgi:hypothetical protein